MRNGAQKSSKIQTPFARMKGMAMEPTPGDDPTSTMPRRNSVAVRKLAAKVAVAFSERSGRPVGPRVKALAES